MLDFFVDAPILRHSVIHIEKITRLFCVLPGTTSGGTMNDIHETMTKRPLGR